MPIPALIIAGTHSGSGKTTITLAILAALTRRGLRTQGFKVGPDFIDPGHQATVTGRTSRNLDTWLLDPQTLAATYRRGTREADLAVIEGVMGLFDGRDGLDPAGSTADLARLWNLPVVLVVDAKGLSRSVAPLVRGYATFDPAVRVGAVVANRVGSHRHYAEYLAPNLRASVPEVAPLGYLLRDEQLTIPSRHLGLLTADEFAPESRFWTRLSDAAEATLDLDALLALAATPSLSATGELPIGQSQTPPNPPLARGGVKEDRDSHRCSPPYQGGGGGGGISGSRVPATLQKTAKGIRVALARDPAFCFYYEDNLDLLRDAGAEIVPFSPLNDPELPENTRLVYLGGGYPEVFADRLAANAGMRSALGRYHAEGGALLAECGGLMACAETLRDVSGQIFPMWGLVPARVAMQTRFAALGYVTAATTCPSPFGPIGTTVRGHEFHYSTLEPLSSLPYATQLLRPGREPRPDGILIGGLLAGYAHLHFGSNPSAIRNLLRYL